MQSSYRPFPQQIPHPQRSPHSTATRRGIGPMIAGAHAQTVLNPAQMQQQQESQRKASEDAKRRSRRPTDKNIPEGVEEFIIGDGVQRYRQLREVESRLDAAMMRKRLDIQDSRNRNLKRYRTLRIWISNTVEDQTWQGDGFDVDAFDFSTNIDSSYRVKIEGRLLEEEEEEEQEEQDEDEDFGAEDENFDAMVVANSNGEAMDEDVKEKKSLKVDKAEAESRYKFSHFFKSMTVEFERGKAKDGTEHGIEWKKPAIPLNAANPPNAADFDQIEFKRGGDENANIVINLVRDEAQERFTLSPALAEIMDASEATRAEVVTGIWGYIKIMGLQEDDEKRSFRCDGLLREIFQRESGSIPYIPDVIMSHLSPMAPIRLHYTIRVDQEFHKDPVPTIYDIRVSLDDPLRAKLHAFNTNPSYPTTLREIATLNDQVATLVQATSHSKAKHTFFTSLSKDPGNFLRKWMSSQKRDLEVLMGEASRGGSEDASGEEWRRGGASSVWGTENVREGVNMLLSSRTR